MKIRMRQEITGSRNGVDWPPRGSVLDLPDEEALGYCAVGIADPVAEVEAPAETATVDDQVEVRSEETTEPEPKPAEVRAWAGANGIDVPARGPIPSDVIQRYKSR